MMGLSRKTDYALVALARLAEHGRGDGGMLSARAIADTYALPLPQMMGVLKLLHRAGLIDSTRGSQGGYSLARRPDQIKVADVVDALEGPVRITICCEEEHAHNACEPCNILRLCPISGGIHRLNEHIVGFLEAVTIDDLMHNTQVHVPLPALSVSALQDERESL